MRVNRNAMSPADPQAQEEAKEEALSSDTSDDEETESITSFDIQSAISGSDGHRTQGKFSSRDSVSEFEGDDYRLRAGSELSSITLPSQQMMTPRKQLSTATAVARAAEAGTTERRRPSLGSMTVHSEPGADVTETPSPRRRLGLPHHTLQPQKHARRVHSVYLKGRKSGRKRASWFRMKPINQEAAAFLSTSVGSTGVPPRHKQAAEQASGPKPAPAPVSPAIDAPHSHSFHGDPRASRQRMPASSTSVMSEGGEESKGIEV